MGEQESVQQRAEFAQVDGQMDVRKRLEALHRWRQEWEQEDQRLRESIRGLDPRNTVDVQLGAQLAMVRRRLRMQLVKEPLSIAPEVVRQMGYAALRAHLVKQFVCLTKEERSRWLQNLFFVLTPDLRQLLEKIEGIRAYRSLGQQRNFLLGGHSGMGKTTFLDWLSSQEAPVVERERTRVPIVKIDAPVSNQTPKPLFQRLILECGMSYVKGDNEEDLLMKIALYFQQCGVEVVIIDEVEHIRRPELRRRLLEVSNRTPGVPFICASCEPVKWVNGDTEVEGRWNDYFHLAPYRGKRLRQLLAYLNLLLPFSCDAFPDLHQQAQADETEQPSAVWIERWTGGIFRDIMLLLLEASRQAIALDLPGLDRELLAVTWKRLQTRQVTNFFLGSEGQEG